MGKILVVAEKPSVARDIARVLKCNQKQEGYLMGETYIISWAIGHLVTLCEPEDYDINLKKWNKNTLPIIPENIKLKALKNTKSQLKILNKLMNSKDVDYIICATDSGREGELIFRYIYDIINCKKPFKRLWISSMTDVSILEGFSNLKDSKEYDNLYLSAKCRSEADWLVGINATRAYTLNYNTLLSIGRVQTPTLAIIVDKQKEIDNFQSKDYYEIINDYGNFKGTWFNKEDNSTKIFDKLKANNIAKKVNNFDGSVESINKEVKKQLPPLLYDLTELQRDCNKKFGFSAKKTLSIAQNLYENKKMITYPRTDSRYLSDDMKQKVKNVLLKLKSTQKYNLYADYVLNMENIPFSKRIIDNSKITDHHAIIPTDVNINIQKLTQDEIKVYNLIVIRFICVFYPNYEYFITKIVTNVKNEFFISKGTTVLKYGWLEIYKNLDTDKIKEEKPQKEDNQKLPEVKKGDKVFVESVKVEKKKTMPPKPYTEATLLSAMENAGRFVEDEQLKEKLKESGLGTPATRAAIIERLISVGYIIRNKKNLIPTEKAKKLIEIVPDELKSAQTTGRWEKGLTSISNGKMSDKKFMESIKRYVNFLVLESQNIKENVIFENEKQQLKKGAIGKCPLCKNGKIFEGTKSFYCSNWKNDCKFTIWKNSLEKYGVNLNRKMMYKLLKGEELEKLNIFMPQTGEKCTAKLTLKIDQNNNAMTELKNVERI